MKIKGYSRRLKGLKYEFLARGSAWRKGKKLYNIITWRKKEK